MLTAFPSSNSNISQGTVNAYLMAVEGLNVSAVVAACKAFIRGEVEGSNPDFAPSAPRLATEAKAIDERLAQEAFWNKTEFVEFDTPEWRALCKQRGGSMPQVERGGKQGWYVPKEEVLAIPQRLIEQERAELAQVDGGKTIVAPRLGRLNS